MVTSIVVPASAVPASVSAHWASSSGFSSTDLKSPYELVTRSRASSLEASRADEATGQRNEGSVQVQPSFPADGQPFLSGAGARRSARRRTGACPGP